MGWFDYFKKGKISLDYNGKTYDLQKGDLPGVKGSCIIRIAKKNGSSKYEIIGSSRESEIKIQSDNGNVSINGVNIETLIEKIQARQR